MPVPQERRVEGGAVLMVMTRGEGTLTLPSAGLPKKMAFYAEGAKPGSKGDLLAEAETAPGAPFTIEVPAGALHRWIYGVAMDG
jgi:hypothetical protein